MTTDHASKISLTNLKFMAPEYPCKIFHFYDSDGPSQMLSGSDDSLKIFF